MYVVGFAETVVDLLKVSLFTPYIAFREAARIVVFRKIPV